MSKERNVYYAELVTNKFPPTLGRIFIHVPAALNNPLPR